MGHHRRLQTCLARVAFVPTINRIPARIRDNGEAEFPGKRTTQQTAEPDDGAPDGRSKKTRVSRHDAPLPEAAGSAKQLEQRYRRGQVCQILIDC